MKTIKIIFLAVSLLLASSLMAAGWEGTPTELSQVIIHNDRSKLIIYKIEWQNHKIEGINPFQRFFVAGGEVIPDGQMVISFNGYPVGAILRIKADERDERYRYTTVYNKAHVLDKLVNSINIFINHKGNKKNEL